MKAFAELLKEEGQNTPVILIPWEEDDYLIFDGERRWRSAQLIPWETLKAVIIPAKSGVDLQTIQSQALSTSIHRKDLHPLDLAECLISQILFQYPEIKMEQERIPTALNTCLQRLKRNQQLSELTNLVTASREDQQNWLESNSIQDVERQILQVLIGYQLNPASINTNVFPMLAIADDLKEIVREFGIEASKLRELNKLSANKLSLTATKASNIRIKTARKVAESNLSLSETRKLVKDLLSRHNAQGSSPHATKPSTKVIQNLQSISVDNWTPDDIQSLRTALEEKLAELRKIEASLL